MKRSILLLSFVVFCIGSEAQAPKVALGFQTIVTPGFPNMGMFLNDNLPLLAPGRYTMLSFGYGMIGQFSGPNFPPGFSWQFRMNFFNRHVKMEGLTTDYGTTNISTDSKQINYDQLIVQFAPGFRLTENLKKVINIYSGVELPFYYVRAASEDITDHVAGYLYSNPHTPYATSYTTIRSDIPGGYLMGIGTFAGISFFVTKRITIGPEIYFGMYYASFSGTFHSVTDNNGTVTMQDNSVGLKQVAFSGVSGALSFNYLIR